MEPAWLQSVLDWVQLHPNATGWLIFIVALGESLLLVGILLPGAAILVGLGTLIGFGVLDFKLAWITASLGAFAGDGISFWIGYHYKHRLLKMWPMYKFPKLIDQGQSFFTKWGALSVFVGRFVGLVRPIIPAIAGIMDMPVKKYLIISTIAAILWSPFYLLPGMLFGSAMGSMTKVAGKLALLVAVFIVTVVIIYWLIHIIYGFLLPRTHRILSRALVWTQNHPSLGRMTSGLIDPRKPEKGSLAFMAAFILALTVTSLIFVVNSETINKWSIYVEGFMHAFHTDWTQPLLVFVLAITHDLAIFLPSLLVFFWLLHRRRKTAAWHWSFLVLSSYLLALTISYFSSNNGQLWFGFHHLSWFVAVITFWAAIISGALPHKLKSWPYSLATILISIVSFAELFFMQMSLGVVLLSIFSAVLWASVVAIAYRMRTRKQFIGWPVSTIFFISNSIAIILVLVLFSKPLLQTKPVDYLDINQNQWYQASILERTDWLNRSKQLFTVKYQGDINLFASQFKEMGWSIEVPNAWKSVWASLNADVDSETITVIPTTHNGKIESMIFTKKQGDVLTALHLWKEPMKIIGSEALLYSGYFTNNNIVDKWGMTYWQNTGVEINSNELINQVVQDSFEIIEQNQQYFIKAKQSKD